METQVAIKRVIFHDMPDFIMSVTQWTQEGGWRGFLQNNSISISWVKCVKDDTMQYSKFHSLNVWEG